MLPRLLLLALIWPLAALAESPLRDHPSPYLAMHADDPVAWREWNHSTLDEAARTQRPIFVSSGYFACHWCHVMQRESYQNATIATLLNTHFIPLKLDRELRPDLDSALFDFTRQSHGIAGWPLNVFLTPEGLPLLGMVYQPPEEFHRVITALVQRWEAEPAALIALARAAAQPVSESSPPPDPSTRKALQRRFEQATLEALHQQGDFLSGGIGNGSKFPQVPILTLLLEHYRDHPELGELLRLSLEQMQRLGLRDHLGGGFFRYTVDPDWRQPHFEKMLYDNAQLARLYLRAAVLLDAPHFRQVGEQTLDFLLRQMWHGRGGLFGSLAALDERDIEGGHYLWHPATLAELLEPVQLTILELQWGMSASPLWDAGYLPMALLEPPQLAQQLEMDEDEVRAQLRLGSQALMRERHRRQIPHDDKRLAGWNALALSAFALASDRQPRYEVAARVLRHYLHSLWDGERLWMMRDNQGRLQQPATLEEYAFVAQGLYDWSQASGDEESRQLALILLRSTAARFHQQGGWQLGSGEDSGLLGRRQALLPCGPLPSAAIVLLRLQRALGEAVLPEQELLWANPPQLLHAPLDYVDYLGLMMEP